MNDRTQDILAEVADARARHLADPTFFAGAEGADRRVREAGLPIGALGTAGGCVAINASSHLVSARTDTSGSKAPPYTWPLGKERWRPTTARDDLIEAMAYVLAEIERIDAG